MHVVNFNENGTNFAEFLLINIDYFYGTKYHRNVNIIFDDIFYKVVASFNGNNRINYWLFSCIIMNENK